MANDRTQSAQVKKNNRAEEWLKNAVKDKHVRLIPFSEISKVKYNVAKGGSGTIHLGAWRNMHVAIKEQHNTNDLIKEVKHFPFLFVLCHIPSTVNHQLHVYQSHILAALIFYVLLVGFSAILSYVLHVPSLSFSPCPTINNNNYHEQYQLQRKSTSIHIHEDKKQDELVWSLDKKGNTWQCPNHESAMYPRGRLSKSEKKKEKTKRGQNRKEKCSSIVPCVLLDLICPSPLSLFALFVCLFVIFFLSSVEEQERPTQRKAQMGHQNDASRRKWGMATNEATKRRYVVI